MIDTKCENCVKDLYRYILLLVDCREKRSKVLVHCKMGVSRSASTVIAFAMKDFGWSLQQAHDFVKQKRGCIKPNQGFMQQLITYQGILDARYGILFTYINLYMDGYQLLKIF